MPFELLFTSAPRGLRPGSFGYCTVARQEAMPEGLAHDVEKMSGFDLPPGIGDVEVVYTFQSLERGSARYFVFSRKRATQQADYSGRANYLAHHVILEEAEVAELVQADTAITPASILLSHNWTDQFEGEARFLEEGCPALDQLRARAVSVGYDVEALLRDMAQMHPSSEWFVSELLDEEASAKRAFLQTAKLQTNEGALEVLKLLHVATLISSPWRGRYCNEQLFENPKFPLDPKNWWSWGLTTTLLYNDQASNYRWIGSLKAARNRAVVNLDKSAVPSDAFGIIQQLIANPTASLGLAERHLSLRKEQVEVAEIETALDAVRQTKAKLVSQFQEVCESEALLHRAASALDQANENLRSFGRQSSEIIDNGIIKRKVEHAISDGRSREAYAAKRRSDLSRAISNASQTAESIEREIEYADSMLIHKSEHVTATIADQLRSELDHLRGDVKELLAKRPSAILPTPAEFDRNAEANAQRFLQALSFATSASSPKTRPFGPWRNRVVWVSLSVAASGLLGILVILAIFCFDGEHRVRFFGLFSRHVPSSTAETNVGHRSDPKKDAEPPPVQPSHEPVQPEFPSTEPEPIDHRPVAPPTDLPFSDCEASFLVSDPLGRIATSDSNFALLTNQSSISDYVECPVVLPFQPQRAAKLTLRKIADGTSVSPPKFVLSAEAAKEKPDLIPTRPLILTSEGRVFFILPDKGVRQPLFSGAFDTLFGSTTERGLTKVIPTGRIPKFTGPVTWNLSYDPVPEYAAYLPQGSILREFVPLKQAMLPIEAFGACLQRIEKQYADSRAQSARFYLTDVTSLGLMPNDKQILSLNQYVDLKRNTLRDQLTQAQAEKNAPEEEKKKLTECLSALNRLTLDKPDTIQYLDRCVGGYKEKLDVRWVNRFLNSQELITRVNLTYDSIRQADQHLSNITAIKVQLKRGDELVLPPGVYRLQAKYAPALGQNYVIDVYSGSPSNASKLATLFPTR